MVFLAMAIRASANGDGSYGYGPKPDLGKPKSAGSYGYGPKPDLGKPKSANGVGSYGYGPKPDLGKPKSEEKQFPTTIGVQGIVYCKLGSKLVPLQGAVTRITCLAVNNQGYESAPFSVLSHETDKKGYFFATLCPSELGNGWKLSECKAFLESSPLEKCDVPTDFNKGISGALLLSHHLLPNKKMDLYSVGPFVYTSNPKSTTTRY
ncbi:hypothetical protein HHK36_023016 [Tetracentron sinense]|uniref:Uncharacterized protein n=1 Tax=Tetracentron sinense TaxID=13715 RepID=A0A834YQJ6_TETSI|nr:hypothetical protein HHK36_023016 [Tetracentron sinense]